MYNFTKQQVKAMPSHQATETSEEEQYLLKKYDIPSPRYTSYPTVPYWEDTPNQEEWIQSVQLAAIRKESDGIQLYIHLPYCERLCTYCGCNKRITINHAVESSYIEHLLKEWRMYQLHLGDTIRISELHLGGGTPTFFSPENLGLLIDELLKDVQLADDYAFSFEAHPGNTTTEHLQTLYDRGFRRLSLGIQDFNPVIQKAINRKQTVEQVEHVVSEARRIGYDAINFDLIFGLPFQTPETISDSIQKTIDLRPERIAFYSYAHVPWKAKSQRGYDENDLPSDKDKLALYEIGKEMFLEAGYETIGMDHFALPGDELLVAMHNGTMHRNFMGYTPRKTSLLIGLGASSISDSGTAMVQNEKQIEDYKARVNEGIIPFFKGHLLNEEDRFLRDHISALMTQYETAWGVSDPNTHFLNEALIRLKPLELDHLVRIESNRIVVTDIGKPFVRIIAMALDARLYRKKPTTSLFSRSI